MTIEQLIEKNKDNLPQGYDLVGVDGNAYSILGYVKDALKRAKWSADDINAVMTIMKSSNYSNLLATACSVIYSKPDHNEESNDDC